TMSSGADFAWPAVFEFPPFFTLQPNAETRRKQLDQWCSLILAYCKHRQLHTLDINEALASSPLFHNKRINRRINRPFLDAILADLKLRGNLEWLDRDKKSCKIVWRTTEQWAALVYSYAKDRGLVNTVCTLYELTDGDDSADQPFHGLDKDVLLLALKHLEKNGQAAILMFDSHEGVKFL
ncbi:hypothetical protein BOX15_Mlig008838g2, partial [Macrostomum lignano]